MRAADWQSDDAAIQLYQGDCLELLPELEAGSIDAVVTDPVWPDTRVKLQGFGHEYSLLRDCMMVVPKHTKRVALHLGCDSDPTFCNAYTAGRWPFFRVCWLEMARPHYKGRLLYGGDVAYLFGEPPASSPGQRVIPGKMMATDSKGQEAEHPCPRKLSHVEWLVKWWSELGETILDPFLGSGTTAVACIKLGRRCIGIEIEPEYFDIAVERVRGAIQQGPDDALFRRRPSIPQSLNPLIPAFQNLVESEGVLS